MVILRETGVLAAICLADLMWTIWVVATGAAVEANPILRFYLERGGLVCFTAAKILLFAGPLLALELLRLRRPEFTRRMMRGAIVVYLLFYAVGVLHLNAPAMVRAMRCREAGAQGRSACSPPRQRPAHRVLPI